MGKTTGTRIGTRTGAGNGNETETSTGKDDLINNIDRLCN